MEFKLLRPEGEYNIPRSPSRRRERFEPLYVAIGTFSAARNHTRLCAIRA